MATLVVLSAVFTLAPSVAAGSTPASAAGYRLTYDSQRSPAGLWAMKGDGTSAQAFHGGGFGSSWSADGKVVSFDTVSPLECSLGQNTQGGKIEVMNADGTGLHQVGTGCLPEISPDGRHVAYQTFGQDAHGNQISSILVVSTSGSTSPVQILPSSCTAYQCQHPVFPTWAGSAELVFVAGREDQNENSPRAALWTIASDGSQGAPSEIPGTEASNSLFVLGVNGLAFDPENKTVLAAGGDTTADHADLYSVPLSGGTPSVLLTAPANHFYSFPQFSPDGKLIAFGDLDNVGTTQNAVYETHVDLVSVQGGTPDEISGSDNTAFDPSFASVETTISGRVTGAGTGKPVSGVTVTAKGPTTVKTTTGRDGSYTLNVDAGSYEVTPSGLHATYKPGSVTADTTKGSQTVDFQMGYKVTGTVIENCPRCSQSEPLGGASIVASFQGSGKSTDTASDGAYTLILGPARWELAASKSGFNFAPPSGELSVSSDRSKIDFSACPSKAGTSAGVGGRSAVSSGSAGCKWQVQARVTVPNGDAVKGVVIRAGSEGWFGSDTASAETDGSGWATFSLDAGKWTVTPAGTHSAHTPSGVEVSFFDTVPNCEAPIASTQDGPLDGCLINLGSGSPTPTTLRYEAPDALIKGNLTGTPSKHSVTIQAIDPTESPEADALYGKTSRSLPSSYSFWAYARSRQGLRALIQAFTAPGHSGQVTECSPGTISHGIDCRPGSSGLVLGATYHVNFRFP